MAACFETKATDRIPVQLLTGCLGSGKSTLLNHLVQYPGLSKGILIDELVDVVVDGRFAFLGRILRTWARSPRDRNRLEGVSDVPRVAAMSAWSLAND